ncbi:MAG: cysteine desulfurase [Christensenellaceae bacterium]|jgi:cysteine desulfurase|nr:cysteine desulfurase [Christensenellaceae bacterium]
MIYFDNAATTRCYKASVEMLAKYSETFFYNPSAMYTQGIAIRNDMQRVRDYILKSLNADGNIIFTSSGTEADNLALLGIKKKHGARIIISASEHLAVYNTANILKQRGYDLVLCPVNEVGTVRMDMFEKLLTKETALVSIMHVNNETGGINDIEVLSQITKNFEKSIVFHSDGTQAFTKIPINIRNTNVDMYTLSSHKIGGPKGVGALYVNKGVFLSPILFGGGQENGLRSSTENVAGIMSFCKSIMIGTDNLSSKDELVRAINEKIKDALLQISEIKLLSDSMCSPYILTFSSKKIRGEVMQRALENIGIVVGTGSACSSSKKSKRVAEAIGVQDSYKLGIIRLSFSHENTLTEAEGFINAFKKIYKELTKYDDK